MDQNQDVLYCLDDEHVRSDLDVNDAKVPVDKAPVFVKISCQDPFGIGIVPSFKNEIGLDAEARDRSKRTSWLE